MNEAWIGIIIGGLIGVIPNIVLALIDTKKQKRQQNHEIKLLKLKLLEIEKQVNGFLWHLGAVTSGTICAATEENKEGGFSFRRVFVHGNRLLVLVSRETGDILLRFLQFLQRTSNEIENSDAVHKEVLYKEILYSEEYEAMIDALRKDILQI